MKNKRSDKPHWLFWLTGGGIIIISVLCQLIEGTVWKIVSEVTLNIGLAIIAVSVIDWIWRQIGGDPLLYAITELRNTTTLLTDLHGTGIKRVFRSRNLSSEYRRLLIKKIHNANEIDMLGIALRSGWASTGEFQKALKSGLNNHNTQFRIAVFDPEAEVTKQRSFEEDGKHTQRIAESASSTLRILSEIKNELSEKNKKKLEIKVVAETGLYCSIIRVDELMFVTKYLLHLSGNNSETYIIEGGESSYYKLYMEEYNATWNRASDWSK